MQFTATTDMSNHELTASTVDDQIMTPDNFDWNGDGAFYADLRYRDQVTNNGGWWGGQRTVDACIRNTADRESPMRLRSTAPTSRHTRSTLTSTSPFHSWYAFSQALRPVLKRGFRELSATRLERL